MTSLLSILALGLFLGMRHATDADHVVAVTTIVSKQRSIRGAAILGALWGVGHTLTIVLVGGAIVLFGVVIPPRVGLSMELGVAVMLVVLGGANLVGAVRRIDDVAHGGLREHTHALLPGGGLRSMVVGVVHGLAGSAAIALLVLATIRDARFAVLYLLVFGFGTVLGMMLLTSAMVAPLAVASRKVEGLPRLMGRLTGVASVVLGLFLAYRIGFLDGLFTGHVHWTPQLD